MPTSFFGLFLFSTALSLMATFTSLGVQALIRRTRRIAGKEPTQLR